ncbi:hypothetical protein TNIN_346321 [Trichonephila inaurata madagascariensis]|uniref:Uncharacterized protein n=1 Tax=Trichonephila inaurata madagascariensis TaxID=2747483 RepID=A0A8X7C9L3_9ARAC|nr:hypothetical protein TNIN_346321 [Trichonephila inaurata madagascariensis]
MAKNKRYASVRKRRVFAPFGACGNKEMAPFRCRKCGGCPRNGSIMTQKNKNKMPGVRECGKGLALNIEGVGCHRSLSLSVFNTKGIGIKTYYSNCVDCTYHDAPDIPATLPFVTARLMQPNSKYCGTFLIKDIAIAAILSGILKPRFVPLPIPLPFPFTINKHVRKPYP